jgi:hypothetical protein
VTVVFCQPQDLYLGILQRLIPFFLFFIGGTIINNNNMVRVWIDLLYKVLYEAKIVVGDDYDGNSRHSTAE